MTAYLGTHAQPVDGSDIPDRPLAAREAPNTDPLWVWIERSPFASDAVEYAFKDLNLNHGEMREEALANMAERLDNMGRHGSFKDLAADFCEALINGVREYREG